MAKYTVGIKPNVKTNILSALPSNVVSIRDVELTAIVYRHADGTTREISTNIGFYRNHQLRLNCFDIYGVLNNETGLTDIVTKAKDIDTIRFSVTTIDQSDIGDVPMPTAALNVIESILDCVDDMIQARSVGNAGSTAAYEDLLHREVNNFDNLYGVSPLEFIKDLRTKIQL